MDKEEIEIKIIYYKRKHVEWVKKLDEYMQKEYELRRAKNLEVQGDYKEVERAHIALERMKKGEPNEG